MQPFKRHSANHNHRYQRSSGLMLLMREARWIIFILFTFLLAVILGSYTNSDPAWSHSSPQVGDIPVHNWVGRPGAWLADLLLYGFGLSAWWLVIWSTSEVIRGYRAFIPKRTSEHDTSAPPSALRRYGGFILLWLCSSALEAVRFPHLDIVLPLAPGGLLGAGLAHLISPMIGHVMTSLLFAVAMLQGLLWWSGLSWTGAADSIGLALENSSRKLWQTLTGKGNHPRRNRRHSSPQTDPISAPARTEPVFPPSEKKTIRRRMSPLAFTEPSPRLEDVLPSREPLPWDLTADTSPPQDITDHTHVAPLDDERLTHQPDLAPEAHPNLAPENTTSTLEPKTLPTLELDTAIDSPNAPMHTDGTFTVPLEAPPVATSPSTRRHAAHDSLVVPTTADDDFQLDFDTPTLSPPAPPPQPKIDTPPPEHAIAEPDNAHIRVSPSFRPEPTPLQAEHFQNDFSTDPAFSQTEINLDLDFSEGFSNPTNQTTPTQKPTAFETLTHDQNIFDFQLETPDAPPPATSHYAPSTEHVPTTTQTALPPFNLLDKASPYTQTITPSALNETGQLIERRLAEFGIAVQVVGATLGPVITRFEIEPAVGVKGSQITAVAKDLARALRLPHLRIEETIPGKICLGIELPNEHRHIVRLSEIIRHQAWHQNHDPLTVVLGQNISGHPELADLNKMSHLLIGGSSGSGKSAMLHTLLISLLYRATPEQLRLLLIDPNMLELSAYSEIPHTLTPVLTDMSDATQALNWCVHEMERRYQLMSRLGVRHLDSYNDKIQRAEQNGQPLLHPIDPNLTLSTLPAIALVVDELAELMAYNKTYVETQLVNLAQKARAVGIHLILATQRLSAEVITNPLKTHITTRMAFQVHTKLESRTLIDQVGAETLLGSGDMLYIAQGTHYPIRIHAAFVEDTEVQRVVEYLKTTAPTQYLDEIFSTEFQPPHDERIPSELQPASLSTPHDAKYAEATALLRSHTHISVALVQKHLRISYPRAAQLVQTLEHDGLVSAPDTNHFRQVLIPTTSSHSST